MAKTSPNTDSFHFADCFFVDRLSLALLVVSSGLAGMLLARRSGPTVCELSWSYRSFLGEMHGSWEGGNRLPLVRYGPGDGGSEGLAGLAWELNFWELAPSLPQQTGIDSDPQPPARATAASHRHCGGVASVCVATSHL